MSVTSNSDAPCGHCQVLVHSNDHVLECNVCSEWYHISCANVSEECHSLVTDNSGLIWVYPTCRVSIKEAVVSTRKLAAENESLRKEVLEIRNNSSELLRLLDEIASNLPLSHVVCDGGADLKNTSSCPIVLNNPINLDDAPTPLPVRESGKTHAPSTEDSSN